jgi:hypothetical protein
MTDVESAVERAKRDGRNRVEIVNGVLGCAPPTAPTPKAPGL